MWFNAVQGFRLLLRCLSLREYATDFRRDKSEKCTYEEVRLRPFSFYANFHVFEVHHQGTPTSVMKKTFFIQKNMAKRKRFLHVSDLFFALHNTSGTGYL